MSMDIYKFIYMGVPRNLYLEKSLLILNYNIQLNID